MLDKAPTVYTLSSLQKSIEGCEACINGKYVPARPLGYYSLWWRFKCAWWIFTGKYDLLKWPEGQ